MLVDGNDKLQAASVGASELNVTPLACCPLRDSEGNQLQLELTVQVTSVQPLQQSDTQTFVDADDTTACVAKALTGATMTVRVAHDLGAAAQITVVLR